MRPFTRPTTHILSELEINDRARAIARVWTEICQVRAYRKRLKAEYKALRGDAKGRLRALEARHQELVDAVREGKEFIIDAPYNVLTVTPTAPTGPGAPTITMTDPAKPGAG